MKSFWKIAAVVSAVTLVCGAGITSHFVRARAKERRLTENASRSRALAERGDAQAEYDLADMYHQGKGVPQDYGQAFVWCRKAAEQANAKAESGLASMYYKGHGVPQDYGEAARWYRKAADQGDAMAEDGLGFLYYQGKGVPLDYKEAVGWYRKAADQGYAKAQYDLGYMYYYGRGVPPDRTEATHLFRVAAVQGNDRAERALGLKTGHLTTISKIGFSIAFLGSLWFLAGSLKPGQSRRQQRIAVLAGLLGLSSAALDLYWYVYVGFARPWSAAVGLDFARHLLIGVTVAFFLLIVFPNRTKVVLAISGASLIAFNLFAIAHYDLRHLEAALRIFSLFNGLFIGASISSAIYLWLDNRRSRGSHDNDNGTGIGITE